jgi:hypothetical protein
VRIPQTWRVLSKPLYTASKPLEDWTPADFGAWRDSLSAEDRQNFREFFYMQPKGANGSTLASFDVHSLLLFCPGLGAFIPEVLANLASFKKKGIAVHLPEYAVLLVCFSSCVRVDAAAGKACRPLVEIQYGIAIQACCLLMHCCRDPTLDDLRDALHVDRSLCLSAGPRRSCSTQYPSHTVLWWRCCAATCSEESSARLANWCDYFKSFHFQSLPLTRRRPEHLDCYNRTRKTSSPLARTH